MLQYCSVVNKSKSQHGLKFARFPGVLVCKARANRVLPGVRLPKMSRATAEQQPRDILGSLTPGITMPFSSASSKAVTQLMPGAFVKSIWQIPE